MKKELKKLIQLDSFRGHEDLMEQCYRKFSKGIRVI